ncbi:MAG: hypothetical protein K2X66_09690 [Cyanobacteria bacterium]|nr:hypothetical protein [Cyanobacteriota bacterium]
MALANGLNIPKHFYQQKGVIKPNHFVAISRASNGFALTDASQNRSVNLLFCGDSGSDPVLGNLHENLNGSLASNIPFQKLTNANPQSSQEVLDLLQAEFNQGLDYIQGKIPLKITSGSMSGHHIQEPQIQAAEILEANATDVSEIDSWYEPKPNGEPTYFANQKWRDWWKQVIQQPPQNWKIFKVVANLNPLNKPPMGNASQAVNRSKILGIFAIIRATTEKMDQQKMTWLEGIRIAPEFNSMMTQTPLLKGVGSAMMTQLVIESLKEGTEGAGLNSSLGAEPFYEKLKMASRPALDQVRTCFSVVGLKDRLAFLRNSFSRFEQLQNKA